MEKSKRPSSGSISFHATGISTVLKCRAARRGRMVSACAAVPAEELPSSPPRMRKGLPPTVSRQAPPGPRSTRGAAAADGSGPARVSAGTEESARAAAIAAHRISRIRMRRVAAILQSVSCCAMIALSMRARVRRGSGTTAAAKALRRRRLAGAGVAVASRRRELMCSRNHTFVSSREDAATIAGRCSLPGRIRKGLTVIWAPGSRSVGRAPRQLTAAEEEAHTRTALR